LTWTRVDGVFNTDGYAYALTAVSRNGIYLNIGGIDELYRITIRVVISKLFLAPP